MEHVACAESPCRQPKKAGIDGYGHLEIKGSEERERKNAIWLYPVDDEDDKRAYKWRFGAVVREGDNPVISPVAVCRKNHN